MDDLLKLKIAASLDLPADTAADPEVAHAIDTDPEARAYARSLHTLDAALRRWPVRVRNEAAWEALAMRIDARIAELSSEARVKKKGALDDALDPTAVPVFQDDPHPSMESHKPMSEPQDQDTDLERLAALTRTSNLPPNLAVPSVRPALTDEIDDTSSGIVDIKQLAAMARGAEASVPPKSEAVQSETAKVEAKPEVVEEKKPTKQDDVMVAPSRAAVAVPKVEVQAPTKGGNTWLGMLGGLALAAGAFAIYNSTTRRTAEEVAASPSGAETPTVAVPAGQAHSPTTSPVPSESAPAPAPAPAQSSTVVAPSSETAEAPVAAPAAPAEVRLGAISAPEVPTSASSPAAAVAPRDLAHVAEAERGGAPNTVVRREAPSTPQAAPARAVALRASATSAGGGTVSGQRAVQPQGAAPIGAAAPARPAAEPAASAASAAPAARPAAATATAPAPPPSNAPPRSVAEMMDRVAGGPLTPAAPAPAPSAELPERPTRSQITTVLSGLNGPVRSCANGQTGTAPVAIVIGSDGAVRSANVSGQFAGTPAGECIAGVVRRARFPAFRAPQVNITYPFVILPAR